MQTIDLASSLPLCRARLNAARIAHSAARKLVNSHPIGARPDLEAEERAAYARVVVARDAYDTAQARSKVETHHECLHTHCCALAEHVAGTYYAHETRCVIHGTRTVGTCD